MSRRRALAILSLSVMLGCQAMAEELPAVVATPSTESTIALQEAISQLLADTPVTLAPDAFTASSLLTLEHAPRRSMTGPRAGSLILEKPEQFKLLITGSHCHVLRVKTGQRTRVAGIPCRPETATAR